MKPYPVRMPISIVSLLGSVVLLTACASGSGSGSSTSCEPVENAGEPDILGAPTFASDTVTRGDTVSVNIPIDADTAYVSVNLFSADRSNYGGGGEHYVSTAGEQMITVSITTSLGTPLDDYFPLINVCTDFGSCTGSSGSTGIAVAYTTDALSSPGPDYARTKYYDGTDVSESSQSCMAVPYVAIGG